MHLCPGRFPHGEEMDSSRHRERFTNCWQQAHVVKQEAELVEEQEAPVLHGAGLAGHRDEVELGQRLLDSRPGLVEVYGARRRLRAWTNMWQEVYVAVTK